MSDRPHDIAAEAERQALLEAEVEDLFAFLKVANLIHDSLEPERIFETLLAAITAGSRLGFERALLLLVDPGGEVLQGRLGVGQAEGAVAHAGKATCGELERIAETSARALQAGRSARLTQVARQLRFPVVEGRSAVVDALLSRRTALLAEGSFEREGDSALRDLLRATCFVVAPIVAGEDAVGVIIADNASSGRPIGPNSVELLTRLTAQAGHALERARTFASAQRARSRAEALRQVAGEMLTSTHLERVLQTAARAAAQVLSASRVTLWLRDPDGGGLRPAAVHGVPANATSVLGALEEVSREAIRDRRTVRFADPARDAKSAGAVGMAAPMVVGEEVLGAIAVSGRPQRGPAAAGEVDPEDQMFLEMTACLASLAVLESRLTHRALDAEKTARESRTELARAEKLATLGELVTRVAQDLRDPLHEIGALAKEAEASLAAEDANRPRLEQMVRQAERLGRVLDESLQLARPEQPRLRMESLNDLLRKALTLLDDRVRVRRLVMVERLAKELPLLLLDHEKVSRAMLNILRSAVDNTPPGGKILVATSREGEYVECGVANEGTSTPGDLAERLFVPIATREDTAGGLGFAVASQIVRDHGGEIRVSVRDPWAAIFTMRFPVRDNQDRRRNDRRGRRERRRAA